MLHHQAGEENPPQPILQNIERQPAYERPLFSSPYP